ncbi:hypothetical protein YC2023_081901 [Brassica napus]
MAHLRTACRGLIAQTHKNRQQEQRPTTPAATKTELLLGPNTTCTRCRSEQKGAATSEHPTLNLTCTQLPRTPPQRAQANPSDAGM